MLPEISKIKPARIVPTYQVQLTLETSGNDNSDPFTAACEVIFTWIKEKFSYIPEMGIPDEISTFSSIKAGADKFAGVIYDPARKFFTFRTQHLDSDTPGRSWITEAEIFARNGDLVLGVRNLCSLYAHDDRDLLRFSPIFVRELRNRQLLRDVASLSSESWILDGNDDVRRLYELVTDRRRMLPITLVAECNPELNEYGAFGEGYLLEAEQLVKIVDVMSHVVYLPCGMRESWNEIVGQEWGISDGAVRIYYPTQNLESDNVLTHPMASKNRILASYFQTRQGEEYTEGKAYAVILSDELRETNCDQRIDWAASGFRFYLDADRDTLKAESQDIMGRNAEEIDINKRLLANYEDKLKELGEEIVFLYNENAKAEEIIKDRNEQLYYIKAHNANLKELLMETNPEKAETPHPSNCKGVASWVEENFPEKMILLPRAKNNLKKTKFVDVNLLCDSLRLLAIDYHNMRMGYGNDGFYEGLKSLYLTDGPSISDSGIGERGDQYFVNYEGKKRKLELHLVGSNSRDPKFCLRVYFFWDDANSMVVVGYAPEHLETRTS